MFCEKLEFANNQIRKYVHVLANSNSTWRFAVAIFMCFLLFGHLCGILFKSQKNTPQILSYRIGL